MFLFVNSIIFGSFSAMIHCFCQVSYSGANLGRFLGLPEETAMSRSTPIKTKYCQERFCQSYFNYFVFSTNVISTIPMLIFYFYASIRIAFKTYKSEKEDQVHLERNSMNNLSHNKDVMKIASVLAIAGISAGIILVIPMSLSFTADKQFLKTFSLRKGDVIPPFLMYIVVPPLVYMRNADLRKYCRELYGF